MHKSQQSTLARSVLLVSKSIRKQGPIKIQTPWSSHVHAVPDMSGFVVRSGYLVRALIGQNKAALRSPAGLSRVRHPQVCPCTSEQRLE